MAPGGIKSVGWLVFFALAATAGAVQATRQPRVLQRDIDHGKDTVDFDYFVYTMTWPGTFCEEKRCTKEPNYFTVHGLWPNYENGKWPAFCNSSYPFNVDEIEDILPTMNKIWPDVLSSHNGNWLWSHEWSKHGTCAKPVLNGEHEYFSKALALYDVLNPTEVFIQNGIVPSNEKTYDLDTVLNVLVTSFGHTFQVSCQESGEDLFQIEYCLQKDFQGRSCGSQLNGNCKKEIRIPA